MSEIDRPKMDQLYPGDELDKLDELVSDQIAMEATYFLATGKLKQFQLPEDNDDYRQGDEPPEIGSSLDPSPEDQSGGGDVIALPVPPAEKFDHFVRFALAAA